MLGVLVVLFGGVSGVVLGSVLAPVLNVTPNSLFADNTRLIEGRVVSIDDEGTLELAPRGSEQTVRLLYTDNTVWIERTAIISGTVIHGMTNKVSSRANEGDMVQLIVESRPEKAWRIIRASSIKEIQTL